MLQQRMLRKEYNYKKTHEMMVIRLIFCTFASKIR